MIYTSYYANLRNLPKTVIPIAISRKVPIYYQGLIYKKLAPPLWLVLDYKQSGDQVFYTRMYRNDILNKLNKLEVIHDLAELIGCENTTAGFPFCFDGGVDIALICYESPEKFCHRHIVAEWLNEDNAIIVNEWPRGGE